MVAGAAGGAVSDGAAELGDAPGPVPGMAVVLAAPGAAVPAAVVSDGRAVSKDKFNVENQKFKPRMNAETRG